MEGSSMSVILVGNGESLLGSKMGEKIDSYDTVVRFDGLNIEGYEKDVGTKTDILVLDSFRFLRYMKTEFDDIRDEMYDISEIWLMPNNQTYNEMAITFQNEFNLKFTEKEVNEYKYELGYFSNCICHSQGVNYVSSELYTMLNYTKSGECVDYIGMDFLNTDLNTLKHELIKEENKLSDMTIKTYQNIADNISFNIMATQPTIIKKLKALHTNPNTLMLNLNIIILVRRNNKESVDKLIKVLKEI